MRTVLGVATAWKHLVVAAIPNTEGLRCELRDGRLIAFGPEWRGQISVLDRLYVAQDVTVLCQGKSGDNVIRVVQSAGQCVRETVSIFRGSVEKSVTVPCDKACPIK